ncbi:ABC transporter permease [Muricoccus pecuniae]|uniref:ABC-type nitrate/sulfonate/bicarbonate transport system permease component n=1 Tax=Muricoccus pecuniae TaxID=693023 RepID=A0A840XYF9_9PROT|nr:ABC transporter permease [Roseomonas pecuniae]MBB5693515.1 ABC-type nitrate/sulfonate/bicarbonate transport system permease component [Roseomonas pecuniae]
MSEAVLARPAAVSLRLRPSSGLLLVLGLLLLWEISARTGMVDSPNWPPFLHVLAALARDTVSGEIPLLVGSTLARMFAGLAAGTLAGVAAGLIFGASRLVRRLLGPTVELIRPIPIPAIIPPLVLFLGLDDAMKVTVAAVTAFFPVLTNTAQGLRAVEADQLAMARSFGVPAHRRLLRVTLPAILPYVLAGLRVALALALVTTVVAEMIAGEQGVGHYLVLMQFAGRAEEMYAAVLVLALLGYGLNRGFVLLERRLIGWFYATGRDG